MSKQVTKSTLSKVNEILEISDSYQAPENIMTILLDENLRKDVFFKFLESFEYDLSYEWFYNYFQDEHADRKNKKTRLYPEMLVTAYVRNDFQQKQ